MSNIRRIHHLFVYQAFYPLLMTTLLALAFFIGRVYLSHSRVYLFMVWNLFLAWIPYWCSLWASYLYLQQPRRWWLIGVVAALWLAFFPNAPYIITDFVHLRLNERFPWWYELGFFTTFALNGLFLGLVSLRAMQLLVEKSAGWWLGWLFALSVIGLSGLGIYLGRFLRWNSWDLLTNPDEVLMDVAVRVLYPTQHLQTYGVTLMFAGLLFVCYLMFVAVRPMMQVDSQTQ